MRKYIVSTAAFIFFSLFLSAQNVPYHVVFDMTSKDTVDQKMLMKWIEEVTKADATAKVEAVFYAQSLDMVTKGKSIAAAQVEEFAKNPNVAFRVCEVAMKKNNVDTSMLIAGVRTVPDGIYEIIVKQSEGYGYIKATR